MCHSWFYQPHLCSTVASLASNIVLGLSCYDDHIEHPNVPSFIESYTLFGNGHPHDKISSFNIWDSIYQISNGSSIEHHMDLTNSSHEQSLDSSLVLHKEQIHYFGATTLASKDSFSKRSELQKTSNKASALGGTDPSPHCRVNRMI